MVSPLLVLFNLLLTAPLDNSTLSPTMSRMNSTVSPTSRTASPHLGSPVPTTLPFVSPTKDPSNLPTQIYSPSTSPITGVSTTSIIAATATHATSSPVSKGPPTSAQPMSHTTLCPSIPTVPLNNSTFSPTQHKANLTSSPTSQAPTPPPGSKSGKNTKTLKSSKSSSHPTLSPSKYGDLRSNMPVSTPPSDGGSKSSKIAKGSKSSKAEVTSRPSMAPSRHGTPAGTPSTSYPTSMPPPGSKSSKKVLKLT